jgi:hypothetical protein
VTIGDVPREIYVNMAPLETRRSNRGNRHMPPICAGKNGNLDDGSASTTTSTSSSRTDDTGSQLPQTDSELKRKLDEMMKEKEAWNIERAELKMVAERLQEQESKKAKTRGPKKNLERGDAFVPLTNINQGDRLDGVTMHAVNVVIGKELFLNMKYYSECYRETCLQKAFDALKIKNEDLGAEEKKKRYAHFVIWYIDQKTTINRNNVIADLKKVFLGQNGTRKYLDSLCYLKRFLAKRTNYL